MDGYFFCLRYTVFTGTLAVYLVGAMSNQSQPHMETNSSLSEGGQSPSAGKGNPAPATGHGARPAGDSGSESGPSHSMSSPDCRGQSGGGNRHCLPAGHGARMGASVRSRRDLSASSPDRRGRSGYKRQRHGHHGRKGDRQRVSSPGPSRGNLVSVLRHRSRSYESDDRSSGTYYPTRDSHVKRRRHHSRHSHVSRRDVRKSRSRQSRTRDRTPRPDMPLSSDLLKVMREMQHTQAALMARLEAHSTAPEGTEVSDTLCVDVARSDSFSSEEETPAASREWRPSGAVPKPAAEVDAVESDQHDDRPPADNVPQLDPLASAVDTDRASYQRTLNCVLEWNALSVPVPQRDTTFGGQLFQHCQEVIPAERHPALPQSELLSSAVRTVNNAIRGVAQSPLEEPGKARDGAQSWGSHISLTSPPIRFYRPDYYKVWHAPDVVPEERVLTNKLWAVDAAALRSGGRPDGAACPVKIAQLRDWEAMIRASLGVLNHLDWFMSTVLVILGTGELTSEKVAEVRNLLSSSGIALNHVSQIQARLLGSNATVRRESILASSVLDKDMRQFLRDQPICLPELFGSKCGEALKVASEDRQKQFILKAALGGPFRSPPLPTPQGSQRFVQRREKGRTSYTPKPQGHTRLPKPSFPPRRPGRGRGRGKPSTAMAGRVRPSV